MVIILVIESEKSLYTTTASKTNPKIAITIDNLRSTEIIEKNG